MKLSDWWPPALRRALKKAHEEECRLHGQLAEARLWAQRMDERQSRTVEDNVRRQYEYSDLMGRWLKVTEINTSLQEQLKQHHDAPR